MCVCAAACVGVRGHVCVLMWVPEVELWSLGSCPAESTHIFNLKKSPAQCLLPLTLLLCLSLFQKSFYFSIFLVKKLLTRVYLGQLHRAVGKDACCQAWWPEFRLRTCTKILEERTDYCRLSWSPHMLLCGDSMCTCSRYNFK